MTCYGQFALPVCKELNILVVKGAHMADFLASDWSRAEGTSGDVTSGVLGWETADQ